MALQLDATSGAYVDLGNSNAATLLDAITAGSISLWVYFDNTSVEQEIWDARVSGANEFELTEFYDNPARKLRWSVATPGGTTQIVHASDLSGSAWHNLVCTWDETANTVEMFVDGVTSTGPQAWAGARGTGNTYVSYQIGAVGGGALMRGRVAQYGLWSVALTAAEAASLSKGFTPLQVRRTSLLTYMPMTGIGATEPDLIQARNGTPTGTTSKADNPRLFQPRRTAAPAASATTVTGTSATTLTIATAASGVRGATGTSASTLTITTVASGLLGVTGTASATLGITTAASGSATAGAVSGSSAVTLGIVSAASGTVTRTGSSAVTLSISTTATGTFAIPVTGTSAATLVITVSASGFANYTPIYAQPLSGRTVSASALASRTVTAQPLSGEPV